MLILKYIKFLFEKKLENKKESYIVFVYLLLFFRMNNFD